MKTLQYLLPASIAVALLAPAVAHADDRQECAAAHLSGQQLRDDGKLVRAREKFLVCVRETCPTGLRGECVDFLTQLDSALPSVVYRAVDGTGNDVSATVVSIDGTPSATMVDGRPTVMDPGPHTFVFDAAGTRVEAKVIVVQGEKNRVVSVTFGSNTAPLGPAPSAEVPPVKPAGMQASEATPSEDVPAPAPSSGRPFPTRAIGYTTAAVGLVGLGIGSFFGLKAISAKSDSEPHCDATGCDGVGNDKRTDAKGAATVSTIAFAFGAVAMAAGIVLVVVAKGGPVQAPQARVEVTTHGLGGLSLRGRF